jgi:hypothetical protein
MSGAYLLYKCRLCGESFTEGHAPSGDLALLVAEGLVEMPREWFGIAPTMVTHHECPADSGIGLADLIGAVPDGGDLP